MMITIRRLIALLSVATAAVLVLPVAAETGTGSLLPLPGIGIVGIADVVSETFDLPNAWEAYSSPTGIELGVENGIYRAYTASQGYVWGLNAAEHTNVVFEVEVTPLTIYSDVGVGAMCRADVSNNGDGYYFMINTSGYYSIQMGLGDAIVPLVDWQPSPAVHTGIDVNTIRGACVDKLLVMYVNDELVASVEDSTYTSGYAGLAAAAGSNGVDFGFDNLSLYAVGSLSF